MDDDYERHIRDGEVFVLVVEKKIAGVLVLVTHPDHLLLDNVAVAPDSQGLGLGARLMAFAEAEALRRNRSEVRLFTHFRMGRNVTLYERLGYQQTHRATVAGFDRVFMKKILGPV